MTDSDLLHMRRALALAALGRGMVEPNPLVGAVLVKDNRIIGEGYHRGFGGPHAEVEALRAAEEDPAGATLYVTLEPCCHHGKTPPCTDAVIAAGIQRVVMAMADPFPAVSGQGAARLKAAGISVTEGIAAKEARELNAPYLKLTRTGFPYIHAKWAMTLDGRIATATGESKWITGAAARAHAHQFRGLVDAIVVGRGTVSADDPMLTARPAGPRTAIRIVLDSSLKLPVDCKLAVTARDIPTLVATTNAAPADRRAAFERLGCEVLTLPADTEGQVSVTGLLSELGRRRLTNVLLEGGAGVLGSFLQADAIDAVRVYVSGKIVGGREALGPVGGQGIGRLAAALHLGPLVTLPVDEDLFVSAARSSGPVDTEV